MRDAVAHYAGLGVSIKRLLTDKGATFRSREFARSCQALGIVHKFTRAYRPQTNGKAVRFIQSTLPEWVREWIHQNSEHQTQVLASWQHHYNWHLDQSVIGGLLPTSRDGVQNPV